jgi:hypothetical protein
MRIVEFDKKPITSDYIPAKQINKSPYPKYGQFHTLSIEQPVACNNNHSQVYIMGLAMVCTPSNSPSVLVRKDLRLSLHTCL